MKIIKKVNTESLSRSWPCSWSLFKTRSESWAEFYFRSQSWTGFRSWYRNFFGGEK